MNRELKAKWLVALRSGEYQQGRGQLWDKHTNKFCCLGVLAKIAGVPDDNIQRCATLFGAKNSGLLGEDASSGILHRKLEVMNDDDRLSFSQIADWIEKNVPDDDSPVRVVTGGLGHEYY